MLFSILSHCLLDEKGLQKIVTYLLVNAAHFYFYESSVILCGKNEIVIYVVSKNFSASVS
jgi:hypothetical protein